MKKIILILLTILGCSFVSFGEEKVGDEVNYFNQNLLQNCFDSVLPMLVGKNIVVFLSNGDISFSGKLVKVYADGLIIENYLKKNLFILKSSIAIVEIKNPEVIKK
ncbi:MAG TPA: hypothetical protein PLO89_06650 [Spirochaetota bacterium]|nr:hypothetical protein [Spirochaetota bacterium]